MTKKLPANNVEELEYVSTDESEDYFYTYDLGCSAALISAGFRLAFMDKTNPRKVQFAFERSENIDTAVEDYWSDRLGVKARAMFDNTKMLKNRIYSE